MKTMQKGFTLIELMIVVAIIAILAAIAIPQYQDYITRSQFTESQTVADGMKTPIQEYVDQTGNCPTANDVKAGLLASGSYLGKYVASATNAGTAPNCTITVTFKGSGSVSTPLQSVQVEFYGTDNGGSFQWDCDHGNAVANKYKPQVCRH